MVISERGSPRYRSPDKHNRRGNSRGCRIPAQGPGAIRASAGSSRGGRWDRVRSLGSLGIGHFEAFVVGRRGLQCRVILLRPGRAWG